MKKITVLILVLLVVLAVVGFSRGWFDVLQHRQPDTGKVDVGLTVDESKMKEDAAAFKEKSAGLADKVTGEARELGENAKDKVNANP